MSSKKKVRYSIILIALNGIQHTVKCIESILQFTEDYELIVVENCSTDGTLGYLSELDKEGKLILIQNRTPSCFSTNNNIGMAKARGEYIVFLNNDTIVTPDWLKRMSAHFENVPLKRIACIGPVSNKSNGRQMVGLQNSEVWYGKYRGRWRHTGILYGWCMLWKADILREIGGFDEQLKNSHEDNDLCLRAQLAGYTLITAVDTYIHHTGQGTLRNYMTVDEYNDNGRANRKAYYDKYYNPTAKKLVAVYRTNGGKFLIKSLDQTSKFADRIIIHFCRAYHSFFIEADRGTVELTRKGFENHLKSSYPQIHKIEWYDGIFQEDYERNWLLQEALKLQAEGEADWCISVDDDEIYEDKFQERVQMLMNPRNPEILAYWANWRTIWRQELDKKYYRTDSTFGSFCNYRFFRLIPGQEISSTHPEGHHCGSAPRMPDENAQWSNIRVEHLGYDTPEQRQKKFEFYQKADNFKSAADIGQEDYSHLIEKNPKLSEYQDFNGISLVMMVKNEEDLILDCLEHVQFLVDEYVIVDTGSTDRTKEILYEFKTFASVPVTILDYPWEDNYSTPRNFGKFHAKYPWILHLDADERFDYEHLKAIHRLTETTDVDVYVFHVLNYLERKTRPDVLPKYASTESVRLFRNIPELFYTGIIHETLDDAICALGKKRKVRAEQPRFPLHHYGYLKKKEVVKGKLEYYEQLNLNQISITDQKDARPYFNLAMHYLEEDKNHEALKAFQEALKINPRFWHASQQMAALNLKSAKSFLNQTLQSIRSDHPFKGQAQKLLDFLNQNTFGFQKVGDMGG
jgi:glycosyltransferase involved in cell wall biosynthesis